MIYKYNFDRSFQVKILTMMVLDPMMLKNYRDILSPYYFESDTLSVVSKLVLDYFDRYQLIPDQETVEALCLAHTQHNVNIQLNDLRDLIGEVYANSLEHSRYILDQIIPFGRRQKIKKAYLDTSPLIEDLEKNEDSIWKTLSEAFRAGHGTDTEQADFMSSWQTLPERYKAFQEDDATGRIPTGITGVDRSLDGGLGMYEVGFLEALPGIGKSRLLVQIGSAGIINRKNVLFITNELHVLDIELMFGTRLSGLNAKQIKNPEFAKQYQYVMEQVLQVDSFLNIVYYPPFRMTISTLRSLISKTENQRGRKIDLIILDMFDRMGGINPKDPFNSQYFLTKELMAVTADFDTRLWTSTHVKHSGYQTAKEGSILGMEHSGGSISKPQDVDVMMSLNQTEAQADQNMAYLGLPKIRRSEGARKIKIYFDKSICFALDWEDYYKMQLEGNKPK